MKIAIYEEVESEEDMVMVLERITELVGEGYTSGYGPAWELDPKEPVGLKDEIKRTRDALADENEGNITTEDLREQVAALLYQLEKE